MKEDKKKINFYNDDENTISLIDIVIVLVRYLKIIIITASIFCIIEIIYLIFFSSKIYQSTAKIKSSSGGSNSQVSAIASQFGIGFPQQGGGEEKWVYPEIIKSRTLARKMLSRKFYINDKGEQNTLLSILTSNYKNSKIGRDTLEIIAVDEFISKIELYEDNRTGIYTITLSANEPRLASDLNEALIEELDSYQRLFIKERASKTKQFILSRILDTERELNLAEENLKDFEARNRRLENSPALKLQQQRLLREVTVLTGVFTNLKQQLENTKIEEVKESDYVIIIDPPEIPLSPSSPKKKLLVIIAGFMGLGVGIIISFILEYYRNFKTEEKEKMIQLKNMFLKNIFWLRTKNFKDKK